MCKLPYKDDGRCTPMWCNDAFKRWPTSHLYRGVPSKIRRRLNKSRPSYILQIYSRDQLWTAVPCARKRLDTLTYGVLCYPVISYHRRSFKMPKAFGVRLLQSQKIPIIKTTEAKKTLGLTTVISTVVQSSKKIICQSN